MSRDIKESSAAEGALLISRREAICRVSALLGGASFIGGTSLLAAYERASLPVEGGLGTFTAENIAFLDEIAETILPETKTAGAKAAKTGAFMALMVTDSYSPVEQKVFREGMRKVDDAAKKANEVSFMNATPHQRTVVLSALDREQKRVMDSRAAAQRRRAELDSAAVETIQPAHYFRMMKELALLGYFTSEIGYTKAMRYIETPGRLDPCLAYTPGEPAWAAHA